MDLNEQIIRELEDCGLNDKQVMSIGKMLYQICYDLNINHVLINETVSYTHLRAHET